MTSSPSRRQPASCVRTLLAWLAAATLLAPGCSREESPSIAPAPGVAPGGAKPSEDAISKLNVGVRLLEQLLPADAAKRFEEALAIQPNWLPALVNLAIARMNVLDAAMDEAAASAAQDALRIAPDDARAKYVLAYVRAERQRNFGEAVGLLRDVVGAEPSDASAWYQLGRAAHEMADGGEVEGASRDALRAEAEAAYRKALALDPALAEANYKLGRLLLDSSDEAKQAEGEAVLARHEDILKGRPAVQQNYYRRGALALAYPFTPERAPVAAPARVTLRAEDAPGFPQPERTREALGLSASRFRGGLSVADLDGDGRLDLIAPMPDASQPALLAWMQLAGGAFAAPRALGPSGRACSSAPMGDLDRDGDVDGLITCNAGNVLLRNPGDGMLSPAPQHEMDWPSVAGLASTLVDVDHDGDLDFHVVEPLGERRGPEGAPRAWRATQWIWRNDGSGAFIPVAGVLGLAVDLDSHEFVWADFDGDNAVDLVASIAGRGLSLAHNDRSEAFSITALPAPALKPSVGPPAFQLLALDVDADADLDLVRVAGGVLTLLLNESAPGSPRFTASEPFTLGVDEVPGALLSADLDLDGRPEVLLFGARASSDGRLATLGVSGRNVALAIRPIAAEGLDPHVAIAADVDGDGDVDLLSRRPEGAPVILRNEMAAGPAWISVLPAGREGRSNAQGLGAKITVDAGTLRAHVERRSLGAPLCHSLAPDVFGLGGRASLDGIGVLWPSGIQQAELDVAPRTLRRIDELDRQPSSCPMLYGWNGDAFAFLTDCFDTAPLGLWVAPGVHIEGDPDEFLRLRPGWVAPVDGVLNLSVAEFLNESLLADRIGLLAIDGDPARSIVVDEAVRLGQLSADLAAWSVGAPLAVEARLDGQDVSAALAAIDRRMVGWSRALPWTGLAAPHELVLDVPAGARLLVLTGSLNFPNSSSLFGAAQAGIHAAPARLEVFERGRWRELLPDCGVPAGFHKDVVIDLAAPGFGKAIGGRAARLRVTTNLQVSWDAARAFADAVAVGESEVRELPLLRAEKIAMGIPAEVQGSDNRWREFPRDRIDPRPKWRPQSGTITPDGDVAPLVTTADRSVAVVRPGEEILIAFDDAALPLAPGLARTHVLVTHGWVKDRDPHTAGSESVDPVPGAPVASGQ